MNRQLNGPPVDRPAGVKAVSTFRVSSRAGPRKPITRDRMRASLVLASRGARKTNSRRARVCSRASDLRERAIVAQRATDSGALIASFVEAKPAAGNSIAQNLPGRNLCNLGPPTRRGDA
ncbi:Hypothetical predicted protein [Olea europaea subsp. europaea]|uniref:Uncharacterized protein n=1 Tax=Olea europaea subsp. europaea TaxID=158383 RepID=A0A8S0TS48_OLEEU|nr:Hypothetical predicted protein [Olea europaea subsp. europaea]